VVTAAWGRWGTASLGGKSRPVAPLSDPRTTPAPGPAPAGLEETRPPAGRRWLLPAGITALALAALLAWRGWPPWPAGRQQPAAGDGLRVARWQVERRARQAGAQERAPAVVGEGTEELAYGDAVRLTVELSGPAHAYLVAFNCDGKEELLWPVNDGGHPDGTVRPARGPALRCPAGSGRWRDLEDPAGGLQAFVVVASASPLPPYGEWRGRLGDLPWRRLPPGKGVWVADDRGVFAMQRGEVLRDQADPPGAPLALRRLCRALRGPDEVVEALAFPVRPRKGDR
jgi:hypothetical protein